MSDREYWSKQSTSLGNRIVRWIDVYFPEYAVDAYQLCELYYKEEFEDHKQRGIRLLNLRHLTRQRDALTHMYVQAQLHLQAALDQVFPLYRGTFGDLYSKVSLLLLKEFPSSKDVRKAGEAKLAERIACLCPSRSESWAHERAKRIVQVRLRLFKRKMLTNY